MAGVTLEQAQAKLDRALSALEGAMDASSFSTSSDSDSFSASTHSLSELQDQVNYWEKRVKRLSRGARGGIKVRSMVRRGS